MTLHRRAAYDDEPTRQRLRAAAAAYDECQEHELAIEYFERYLGTDPPDAFAVAQRVGELRKKVACTKTKAANSECDP